MTSTSPALRKTVFVTTRWSVVLAAGRSDTPRTRDALARLTAGNRSVPYLLSLKTASK